MSRKITLTLSLCLLAALVLVVAAGSRAKARTRQDGRALAGVNDAAASLNLKDFGAVGDGVTDDGPALQAALDALAAAGGGTLFVPEGRYAVLTTVVKSFAGTGASINIYGVPSDTPVPPPTAAGEELSRGLNLKSEFRPRTGVGAMLVLAGLRGATVKDIAFVGTPDVLTDAAVTLGLFDIDDASVEHCEFYGLSSSTLGSDVVAVRSHFKITRSVFLGCTANSGVYTSVVQNAEWKGFRMEECIFLDYGQRPELLSKTGLAAPFAWVDLGETAALTNDSPRREAVFRSVFMDEGGLTGIASFPTRYSSTSPPADLVYVTGLRMNVSNLGGTAGHYLTGVRSALVENSAYGWSIHADSAINFAGVGHGILDRIETEASATRLRADAATARLTVIDSEYTDLASLAEQTIVIETQQPDEDPVQYVRGRFQSALARAPDAAAHFYWSDKILRCGADSACVTSARGALDAYLAASPAETFRITGKVTDELDAPVAGAAVALTGSQTATTTTDADGLYHFSKLPTSGVYVVTASKTNYAIALPSKTFTTPAGDVAADFAAALKRFTISGRVANGAGVAIQGVTLALSGSQTATATATTDSNRQLLSSQVSARAAATSVTPSKTDHTFSPASRTFPALGSDQTGNFTATPGTHAIRGRVTGAGGGALAGATLTLSGSKSATATSDANGEYSFTLLPSDGTYTVTATKPDYAFTPPIQTFAQPTTDKTANFAGALVNYTISGRVTDINNAGMQGVTVALTGSQTATTTTDADGSYSFPSLASDGTYTVTPSLPNFTFTPASKTFAGLDADSFAGFTGGLARFRVGGRVTEKGAGVAGVAVDLAGSHPLLGPDSRRVLTDANGAYSFDVTSGGTYFITPSKANYTFSPSSQGFDSIDGDRTADFDAARREVVEFTSTALTVGEGGGTLEVTVTRGGDTSEEVSAVYEIQSGTALRGSDLVGSAGRVTFAPGETTKTFTIFITDDAIVEGAESFSVALTAEGEAVVGDRSTLAVTISDNDNDPAGANPIDEAEFFVRQNYRDFLGRDPDAPGLAFWTDQIRRCGADAACAEAARINVSAAFFLAIEFQQSGFFAYKTYKAAYGRTPERLREFTLDAREISAGVVVGETGWELKLEMHKRIYVLEFVARPEFERQYPLVLTPAQFVAALDANTGNSLTEAEAASAAAEFADAANSEDLEARARVLRTVVENGAFHKRETNPAFVLMEYFGYLRRAPDDPPNTNLDGFNFWLKKLDDNGGDFKRAEMVKAFLSSEEYRKRFGNSSAPARVAARAAPLISFGLGQSIRACPSPKFFYAREEPQESWQSRPTL